MKIILPKQVNKILNILMNAGYEAYAVGGCVRDSLLGRTPDDWDITTSASPMEVKGLFRRTIDTGIEHGTVTIMMGNDGYEVTTYRIDGAYEDCRHPNEVIYTKNLIEDLKRRDFTINAMAYNEKDGLVDAFDGRGDLERKIICAVGNPEERFTEDALRIMRSVRFAAQLGYSIEENTFQAGKKYAGNLAKISAERIQTELVKLICSDHPEKIRIAYDMGVTEIVLPEFDAMMKTSQENPHHIYSVGEHTIHALQEIKKDGLSPVERRYCSLAMLLHDCGKPYTKTTDEKGIDHFHQHAVKSEELAGNVLHRLKLDNDTIKIVKSLVKYHDYKVYEDYKEGQSQFKNAKEGQSQFSDYSKEGLSLFWVRRSIHMMGWEVFRLLYFIREADILAQSGYLRDEKLKHEKETRELEEQILKNHDALFIKDLKVNGNDLIKAGLKPGKEIGIQLEQLLDRVLEEPSLNEKEILLGMLTKNKPI